MTRSLKVIAAEIRADWPIAKFKWNGAARPYLDAMETLDKITDRYYADSGTSIVAYFLSNVAGWRGPVARAIKKELNEMLNRGAK